MPVPGATREYEWRGWAALDQLAHASDPAMGFVASANGNVARLGRIGDVLADPAARGIEGFQRLQQDVRAWNAERLVPLLTGVVTDRADLDEVRQRLLRWDRRITAESQEATVYVAWERELTRRLASLRLPSDLAAEYVRRATQTLVPALTGPSRAWFDGEVEKSRDHLLVEALAAAVEGLRGKSSNEGLAWGRVHTVTFSHPLGISDRPARRFNVGPFAASGYSETVSSISSPDSGRSVGPSFRAIFDLGDWDRSLAMNAPGQSGSPGSPHFGDLAAGWAAGQYFPLAFSDRAVQANAQNTLMLVPQ
jgi:penicillin G amidase